MALLGVIVMGVTSTQAGIIVNYTNQERKSDVCRSSEADTKGNFDRGIIVNLTGIIVNLTGIIVNFGEGSKTTTNCGIIVNR